MCTYAAFNKLNTIVAAPLVEVGRQIYKKFKEYFPEKHIGRIGDGYNDISTDITVSTYASLGKCALEKCQMLLMDEVQNTGGDEISNLLKDVQAVRNFGYTATDSGMFNGCEKLLKGLFGERLIHIEYDEAMDAGAVVPGLVYFVEMPADTRGVNAGSIEMKLAKGIKRCEERNKLVGEICSLVPDQWQTLVFVDHINDHLIPLYKEMPNGTKYIHRNSSKKDIGSFALSPKQQKEAIENFKEGETQFLLATDCLKAGADFPNVRVVVQASGGTSEVELLQEAFRGSRTAPGKEFFVLIDVHDTHDEQLHTMSLKRQAIYEKQGWKIKTVSTPQEIDWYDYKPEKLKL